MSRLPYTPSAGFVLGCDYHNLVKPEMSGWHRVIVVSPKSANRRGTCLVVPITSKKDKITPNYHMMFPAGSYPFAKVDSWVKVNLISHVSFDRLNITLRNDKGGSYSVRKEDFFRIKACLQKLLC